MAPAQLQRLRRHMGNLLRVITNFEHITTELTEKEMKLLPLIIKGFSSHGITNPIKEPAIVAAMKKYDSSFNDVKLRKFCNVIRTHGILPLMGTSRGYYISYDKTEIAKQIKSQMERGYSNINSAKGLQKFL